MKDELKDTQGFFQILSDKIHFFMRDNVPDGLVLISQIMAKLLLLAFILVLLDVLFKLIFRGVHTIFYRKSKETPFLQALYESKVLNSIAHFCALGIVQQLIEPIMKRHPSSHEFLQRTFAVLMILAGYFLFKRILKSVERFYVLKRDFYRITAIRAITQSLEIAGMIVFGFLGVSNIFGVSASTIWGSLTAMTAVLVLVFRDTILGFVTGIHVSTSKSVKVGDWIGIPKYNIEGTIEEISLLTTKIQNFDKTISTIPTYDLLSTEIKNHQVMAEGNRRRIKKSIVFNINSFKFIDEDLHERLSKINLISDYLQSKAQEISTERKTLQNSEYIINGRQLTNIGVFRKYALSYLKQDKDIDQDETLLVRQLDITPQGMPLEVYCFANKSAMADFEDIQADIFDHLLAASKAFDLEVMQVNKI